MNLEILISTIVTSTAALIAIIGGFLVSRVITLSSEQNGTKRKLKEIKNEIKAKERVYSKIIEYILEEDAYSFIVDNTEEILKNDKTLEEIHKEDKFTDLTVNQLEPFVKEFRGMFAEIYKPIRDLLDNAGELPYDFYEFKNKVELELSIPNKSEWYETAYDYYYDQIPKRKSSLGFPPLDLINKSNISPINQYYKDQVKIKEQLETELAVLRLQKEEQEKVLSEYGSPNGIWSGILVLIYSGIVGIAYPITLLPYPLDTYNDSLTKIVLITLFLSELVALFGYLIFAMKKLTTNKS